MRPRYVWGRGGDGAPYLSQLVRSSVTHHSPFSDFVARFDGQYEIFTCLLAGPCFKFVSKRKLSSYNPLRMNDMVLSVHKALSDVGHAGSPRLWEIRLTTALLHDQNYDPFGLVLSVAKEYCSLSCVSNLSNLKTGRDTTKRHSIISIDRANIFWSHFALFWFISFGSQVMKDWKNERKQYLCHLMVHPRRLGDVNIGWSILLYDNVGKVRGLDRKEALGSHFVSYGTIKCIVGYGKNLETRWWRPWFSTLNAASLVLYIQASRWGKVHCAKLRY